MYIAGNGGTVRADASFTMNLGDGSEGNNKGAFGFVNVGQNNKIISNISNVALQNNSVYIYSKDTSGTAVNPQIENNTDIIASGKNNYGIYSAGYVVNTGNMNLQSGTGNVGVYSIKGGTIENRRRLDGTGGVITVGGSIPGEDEYGVGMAAGYSWTQKDLEKPLAQRPEETTGNIINRGTINVNGKNSIGMYASGSKSTVENATGATINLRGEGSMGIYLDNGATGTNNGTITTVGNPKGAVGLVVRNGSTLVNNGTISIDSQGGYGQFITTGGIVRNYGTFHVGGGATKEFTPGNKPTGKAVLDAKGRPIVEIKAGPGAVTATIEANGKLVTPVVTNVSGKRISRHFEILTDKSKFLFASKDSGKILKIAREHLGNEKVVKLPTLIQTIGARIKGLFAKKS